MRTSALWLVLLAGPAIAQELSVAPEPDRFASRFELGLPAEVTLVGLTYGVRPEVLFRFGEPGTVSRLRLAVGLFDGPDQFFLPVSLGYRAVFRQAYRVHPVVGAGLEYQARFTSSFHPVHAGGVYLEGGVGVQVAPRWTVGAMAAVDVMFLGTPGFGLSPRLFVTWQL